MKMKLKILKEMTQPFMGEHDLKQNSYIFIQENAFENACKKTTNLSLPQCVNLHSQYYG